MAKKNKGGQPPIYSTPEEMQVKIDEYFRMNTTYRISALAYHLGFESRQSIYDYKKRPEFSYIIKRALLLVEDGYEEELRSKSVAGAIFALKNMGWKDSQQIDHTSQGGAINLSKLSDDALDELNRLAEDNPSPDKG